MHHYGLLAILAVGFTLALLFGYIAQRFKLSPIVGYLLAGIFLGPHTPGFVADAAIAGQLAEAGVILLMFGVGLHFNMGDLFAVRGVALPGAIFQVAISTMFGIFTTHLFGIPYSSGVILGLGLAVASTVVLLRVLTDANAVDTVHGHVAIGWLVVEDIITILALVMLPIFASIALHGEGSVSAADILFALGKAVLRIAVLWVIVLVIGGKVAPWLLAQVVRTRSQELFILAVLVTAFATAVSAAVFFQASMALGAFLGGMVVGKTKLSHQAGAEILPLKDAFCVLFFLSVGMLFDPGFLMEHPFLVMLCMFIVLIVKPLSALGIIALLGYSARTGLTVGMGLAQVGEFSFILAASALELKIIPQEIYTVLVVCAIVSITINPLLFRAIPKMEKGLMRREKLWAFMNRGVDKKAAEHRTLQTPLPGDAPVAIVVGYGPTGRRVSQALADNGVTPVVIDMNVDTVTSLSANGQWAVCGNSARRDILHAAGIERAGYLIITLPDAAATVDTAVTARNMSDTIRILARARFLAEKDILKSVGVNAVAFEEAEIADALTRLVMDDVTACGNGECAVAGVLS